MEALAEAAPIHLEPFWGQDWMSWLVDKTFFDA